MKGVLVVLVASIAALAATSAHATIDTCLMVRNTPDGFLALREGPGTQCKVKARLKPGELLIADVETTAGQWTHINYVPRLDGRIEEAKRFTQGWVATKFTKDAPRCSRAWYSS